MAPTSLLLLPLLFLFIHSHLGNDDRRGRNRTAPFFLPFLLYDDDIAYTDTALPYFRNSCIQRASSLEDGIVVSRIRRRESHCPRRDLFSPFVLALTTVELLSTRCHPLLSHFRSHFPRIFPSSPLTTIPPWQAQSTLQRGDDIVSRLVPSRESCRT
ncbi:hypothetical protein BJV74DRAFT_149954 [Russula compacta]|nr:hypothetical protein BJV74DRAFT_149954 [Russula compacta]